MKLDLVNQLDRIDYCQNVVLHHSVHESFPIRIDSSASRQVDAVNRDIYWNLKAGMHIGRLPFRKCRVTRASTRLEICLEGINFRIVMYNVLHYLS